MKKVRKDQIEIIQEALREISRLDSNISIKELGEVFITSCKVNGKPGLHISNVNAEIEIDKGWEVSFEELGSDLVTSIDTDTAEQVMDGLRMMADMIENHYFKTEDTSP